MATERKMLTPSRYEMAAKLAGHACGAAGAAVLTLTTPSEYSSERAAEYRIDAIANLRAALILLGDTTYDGRAAVPADEHGFAPERGPVVRGVRAEAL